MNQKTAKTVLIGEAGVGKTSIISRFLYNTYNKNEQSTTGVSYSSKILNFSNFDNSELILEIWDTAGQERYRNLNRLFYNEAKLVIIVFDLTRKDSFKAVRDYWAKEVEENGLSNAVIGLVGNKSDEFENFEVDENEINELATNLKAIYRMTSAKSDDGSINDFFYQLGEKVLVKMLGINKSKKDTVVLNSKVSNKKKKVKCC